MYANNNHYKWIENVYKVKCSELGKEVANIIGYVGMGIYNAPVYTKKVDWSNKEWIEIKWRGSMATYDFQQLTMLVIECFRRMIRAEISPCNCNILKITFWKRKTRDMKAMLFERLPTIEYMIKQRDKLWKENQNEST